jgi:hypothetical protein
VSVPLLAPAKTDQLIQDRSPKIGAKVADMTSAPMTPNLHNGVGDGVLGGRRVTANNECQSDQPVQLDLVVTSECRNVAHDMDLRHGTCSWRLMPSASLHHTAAIPSQTRIGA